MAKKIDIDKKVKNKVLNFAKLLEKSGIKADKIILYGSHVKGKAADYSDIDLCVVSSLFAKNSDYYFKKIWHLATQVDSSLEPIPFTQQELVDKYSTLSYEIRKYGVRII